jgi:hypothetical protein
MPVAPSIAQRRGSKSAAQLEEPGSLMMVGVDPELSHHRLVLVDSGGCVRSLVRVDADGDQGGSRRAVRMWVRRRRAGLMRDGLPFLFRATPVAEPDERSLR